MMKRSLLLLPALALALAACTPASPESAAESAVESAAESTAAAQDSATAETATFPVGRLVEADALWQTADAYYIADYDRPPKDGIIVPYVLKLDFATATEEKIWQAEQAVQEFWQPIVQGGQIYLVLDSTLYRIPLEGGEATSTPLPEGTLFSAADEYGLYSFAYERASNTVRGSRMDMETGQFTDLTLPPQTQDVHAVGENRFLLTRLLTEAPLPNRDESEMYQAAVQNAIREYDWYDPATGALEKIFEEPYYHGAEREDGTRHRRSFIGANGQRLYFDWRMADGENGGIESCRFDGTDWQPVPDIPENITIFNWGHFDGDHLRWLFFTDDTTSPLQQTVYDLDTGTYYPHVPNNPINFIGSGYVVFETGHGDDAQGIYTIDGYWLAPVEDFLNGSTEGTRVATYSESAS